MKANKIIKVVSKISLILSTFIFGVSIVGGAILMENADAVNAAFNIETVRVEKGESNNSDKEYYKSAFSSVKQVKKNGERYVETVAQEGITLLKNENNALPLQENAKVSLFSTSSVQPILVGTGSSGASSSGVTSLKDGLENAGIEVNPGLWDWYNANWNTYGRKKSGGVVGAVFTIGDAKWDQIDTTAKTNKEYGDAAIFMISRSGGEGIDSTIYNGSTSDFQDGNYLKLSPTERNVLENLKLQKDAGVFKKIIVLMNTANQVECEFVDDPSLGIDSLLWVGTFGQTGAKAIGNIIAGKVNPSGRLPDTFWKYHYLNPVHANYAILVDTTNQVTQWVKTQTASSGKNIVYQEGMYMGYRYSETRYEDTVLKDKENVGEFKYKDVISYPFGYGLSYTNFEFSNMQAKKIFKTPANGLKDHMYSISVDVKNTGNVAGKQVAQLYLQKPFTQYDIENHIEKPSVELVGFAKTKILKPNESQTLTIEVSEREFASFDAYKANTYIVDEGDYYFSIGTDSHDAVNNILAKKGKTTSDGMTYNGNADLVTSYHMEFDDKTYSTSSVTGNPIKNQFDNADLKRYEGAGANATSFEYVTRTNWEGTVKFGLTKDNKRTNQHVKIVATDKMQQDLTTSWNPKMEPDDGEYPIYGSTKTNYQLIDLRAYQDDDTDPTNNPRIPFDDPMWEDLLNQLTWDETVYLVSHGFRKTAPVGSIGKPETIDHNGAAGPVEPYNVTSKVNNGLAVRKNDPDKAKRPAIYPCNGLIAATFNLSLANYYGRQWGEDCLWAGYSGLYGMGCNTHRSAYGGRNFEYYSEDPVLMGKMAAESAKGMATRGVYVYLKHCFLNDQETYRCGGWTWSNEQTIREIYLKSFQIAIEQGGAQCIMGGLNSIGMMWTGVQGFMEEVLRGEFGMTGHAVTDTYSAYNGSFVRGINYGNDIPDGNVNTSTESFEYASPTNGGYSKVAWNMRKAAHRVLYTVVHSNAMNGYDSNTRVIRLTPGWVSLLENVQFGGGIYLGVSSFAFAISIFLDIVSKVRNRKEEA